MNGYCLQMYFSHNFSIKRTDLYIINIWNAFQFYLAISTALIIGSSIVITIDTTDVP